MKKFILLSILLASVCFAQSKETPLTDARAECQFSFEKLAQCFYRIPNYTITADIESENIANDEKSLKKIYISTNGNQQTLEVSKDTNILSGDIGYISFTDINFDKVPDLAITTSFGTPNLYLDYWIFDSKEQKYLAVGNHPKFDINKQKKTLNAKIKDSADNYQNIEWHWNNNTLEKR